MFFGVCKDILISEIVVIGPYRDMCESDAMKVEVASCLIMEIKESLKIFGS